MLIQFSVTNFQCLKEKTTLDMRSVTLSEHKKSLINDRLLPLASIYGPNGGGKTTMLKAFSTLQALIIKHFNVVGGMKFINDAPVIGLSIQPFKFDEDSINSPTEFEVYIEVENLEYKYYISILDKKIIEESLHYKKPNSKMIKSIFEREKDNVVLGKELAQNVKVASNISSGMPVLAWLGLVYDIEHIKRVINWFRQTYCVDYNMPFMEELLLNNIYQLEFANDERSAKIRSKMTELLSSMDLHIKSYRVERIPLNNNQFSIKVSTVHRIDNQRYELDLQEESNGTKKIFGLLPLFVVAINEGRTVVIDELDAKIHPMLLKFILEMFSDSAINTKGAQLIFTSHDMTTMTKEVFRRDEIWFMAMNDKQYSMLYSLIEMRTEDGELVRNDAVYNKQYIEGRYGADPYLKAMKSWKN